MTMGATSESNTQAVLVLACGALANELVQVLRANAWDHVRVQCLPARLHNRPERIPEAVREAIHRGRAQYRHIFVAYADCGTGGALDRVLEEEGVERMPGAHCYEFFAGSSAFTAMAEEELGTFYLTDFLARHFDRLVLQGLGIDRCPELLPMYFGNYRRMVYLAQRRDEGLRARAEAAAQRLGLELEVRYTGLASFQDALAPIHLTETRRGQVDNSVLA